jgi:hypothetical protein
VIGELRDWSSIAMLVACNTSRGPIRFTLDWRRRSFAYTLAPNAMVTFDWDRPA